MKLANEGVQIIPINGETWLVCGGRAFNDQPLFDHAMLSIAENRGLPRRIVNGGANGADKMSQKWAAKFALMCHTVMAEWDKHGKAAGHIRNQDMLDRYKPDLVVAFPGGKGTANMVARSNATEGVVVMEIVVTENVDAENI